MGYEMLELYEAKVSCTVLRGERRSNLPDLPDNCVTAESRMYNCEPIKVLKFIMPLAITRKFL